MAADLVPILTERVVLTRRFWISTHTDVAGAARVRAVRRWLVDLVAERREALAPY
jgi:hypothetical protein